MVEAVFVSLMVKGSSPNSVLGIFWSLTRSLTNIWNFGKISSIFPEIFIHGYKGFDLLEEFLLRKNV